MTKKYKAYYRSEIGLIEIVSTEDALLSLNFVEEKSIDDFEIHPFLKGCIKQLDEYFKGKRQKFTINLQPQGTDFQKRVWEQLVKIPLGKTVSYMDIAASIGNKKACRAVGGAIGKNKIGIIIPCHRVIGSDGSLTGFGSGIWRKKWLLNHEREVFSKK